MYRQQLSKERMFAGPIWSYLPRYPARAPRHRRKRVELKLDWPCSFPGCGRQYSSKTVLQNHVRVKHPDATTLALGEAANRPCDVRYPKQKRSDDEEKEGEEAEGEEYSGNENMEEGCPQRVSGEEEDEQDYVVFRPRRLVELRPAHLLPNRPPQPAPHSSPHMGPPIAPSQPQPFHRPYASYGPGYEQYHPNDSNPPPPGPPQPSHHYPRYERSNSYDPRPPPAHPYQPPQPFDGSPHQNMVSHPYPPPTPHSMPHQAPTHPQPYYQNGPPPLPPHTPSMQPQYYPPMGSQQLPYPHQTSSNESLPPPPVPHDSINMNYHNTTAHFSPKENLATSPKKTVGSPQVKARKAGIKKQTGKSATMKRKKQDDETKGKGKQEDGKRVKPKREPARESPKRSMEGKVRIERLHSRTLSDSHAHGDTPRAQLMADPGSGSLDGGAGEKEEVKEEARPRGAAADTQQAEYFGLELLAKAAHLALEQELETRETVNVA